MSDTEMEHASEMEEEVDAEQAAPASKKGRKKGGRKSGGGGGVNKKKVSKTPAKGTRSSGRRVKPATPKSAPAAAPAPKTKSKAKGRGRPKSGGGKQKTKKEDKDWEVEKILGVKRETSRKEFLVKWKGWAGKPTWEPEGNVEGCQDLVQEFVNSL